MQNKNVFFFIIDALRFDAVQNEVVGRELMPVYSAVAQKGVISRVTTNGQVTKFVMPSIFSQSYPLDFGGYNDGIKNRPKSFVEVFKEHGYNTIMLEGHDIDGPHGRIERGFDTVRVYHDKRLLLEGAVKKRFLYDIKLWRKGEMSDDEIVTLIQNEYGALLTYLEGHANRVEDTSGHRTLGRFSASDLRKIRAEIALLENDPMAVIEKIERVSPFFFFDYLGMWPVGISLKFRNKFFSIGKSWQKKFNALFGTEINFIPSRPRVPPIASTMLKDAVKEISKTQGPWFTYVHIMDPHDHTIVNRPLYLLDKLRFLPRTLRARKIERDLLGYNPRRVGYDLTLAYVDHYFGRFLAALKRTNADENTICCLIGDHGEGWDEARDAKLRTEFGYRTHHEHISIPLMVSPVEGKAVQDGMADSMSIAATMLDLAGLPQDPAFKGRSIFDQGWPFVVTENCGRGNADIERRDIYFTVTGPAQKLMARLTDQKLIVERYYDLALDPRELTNVLVQVSAGDCREMIDHLYAERKNLFELRGVPYGSFELAQG